MNKLVTLTEAKANLLVADTESDALIDSKIDQATDTVRKYLKSQSDRPSTVSSSSVASPTLITTAAAHGYATGDSVTITGHTGSTPELSGPYAVTVVSSTTFTVPVNVTVAGTGGTAVVEWDVDTVPGQVKASVLVMISHLYENRGDDMSKDADVWGAIGRLLAQSRDPALA